MANMQSGRNKQPILLRINVKPFIEYFMDSVVNYSF